MQHYWLGTYRNLYLEGVDGERDAAFRDGIRGQCRSGQRDALSPAGQRQGNAGQYRQH
jgi:hypothetical protein